MSQEHIPAWKRIGLKVKEELQHDPLDITAHLDSGTVTAKQTKKLNKKKSKRSSGQAGLSEESKEKKPPKRVKLPKSERPPPPEKDQLAYLRIYTTDRDNWKFSKQKQNWLVKHINIIEDDYENYLFNYLAGIKGATRERLLTRMREVVDTWNQAQLKTENNSLTTESIGADDDKNKEKASDAPVEDKEKDKTADSKDEEQQLSVDSSFAIRAKTVVEKLTGETLKLEGIDLQDKVNEEENEDEKVVAEGSRDSEEAPDNSEQRVPSISLVINSADEPKLSSSSDENTIYEDATDQMPASEISDEDAEQYQNLIVEEVEIHDYISPEDFPKAKYSSKKKPQKMSASEHLEDGEELTQGEESKNADEDEEVKKDKKKKDKKAKKKKKQKHKSKKT